MTLEELEDTLPNGFHDSYLVGASVDFLAATCILEIDVNFDDPDPEVFRRMKVRLTGLSLFIAGPPDTRESLSLGRTLGTSGYGTDEKMLPDLETYRKNAPAGSFFYSFFLNHENCFIHLAAKEAALEQV